MSDSKLKKPFFAQFLEHQVTETDQVLGGTDIQTLKFPSDSEDSGSEDLVVTLKFPSDTEESGGCDIITDPNSSCGKGMGQRKRGRRKSDYCG